jgi:ferritin heavy chain
MVVQSLAKQNYIQLVEDAVNQQIQMYQMAQQTYLAASAYFDNAEVALPASIISMISMDKKVLIFV